MPNLLDLSRCKTKKNLDKVVVPCRTNLESDDELLRGKARVTCMEMGTTTLLDPISRTLLG